MAVGATDVGAGIGGADGSPGAAVGGAVRSPGVAVGAGDIVGAAVGASSVVTSQTMSAMVDGSDM